jgi:hypothetical protein
MANRGTSARKDSVLDKMFLELCPEFPGTDGERQH